MIGIAVLAAFIAGDPASSSQDAKEALTRAAIALRDTGPCAVRFAGWEQKADELDASSFATQERIEGLLGARIRPETVDLIAAEPIAPRDCTEVLAQFAEVRAKAALGDVERISQRLEAVTDRGVWLGLFPLCASTVLSADVRWDRLTEQHTAYIDLRPEAAEEWRSYSEEFGDNSLPSRISLRLNGTIISRPYVVSAIGPRLTLSGRSLEETNLLAAGSLKACDARSLP